MVIPRWATLIFAVAAILQAIDGTSTVPGPVGVVLAALSLAALCLIATGRVRYALFAMAAALLAVWLGVVASADSMSSEGDGPVMATLFVALPVIAITVAVLTWRNTKLTLATLLASAPTILSIAAAFVLAIGSA